MSNAITINLDAVEVIAQRDGATITFEFCSHAGRETFTLTGTEFQRLLKAWSTLNLQWTLQRARERDAEAPPPPPPPKPDPLTRLIAWLREDVTGDAS
jgi:hypothetical protein